MTYEVPNIFLHLGLSKTGTSFLQSILDHPLNSGYLSEQGVFVLKSLFSKPEEKKAITYDQRLIQSEDVSEKELEARFNIVLNDIPQDVRTIIYTNEATGNIYKRDEIDRLYRIIQRFRCSLILFTRRRDIRLQSEYSQAWVAYDRTPQLFLERAFAYPELFFHYSHRIDRWAQLINKENVFVFPYEKEQLPNGIESLFFDCLGLSCERLTLPKNRI